MTISFCNHHSSGFFIFKYTNKTTYNNNKKTKKIHDKSCHIQFIKLQLNIPINLYIQCLYVYTPKYQHLFTISTQRKFVSYIVTHERKSTSQIFEMTPNSGEYPRREKHEYKIEYWPLEHVVTFALRQNFNPETCVSSFPLIFSLRYFELAM